jgi:hypothetical protein
MHIAVITAVHRRYALTALYWAWTAYLCAWWADHQVTLIAAVSDDEHAALAAEAGATVVETANRPLGRKFNAALQAAEGADADAVLIMGSDDFLCPVVAGALLAACVAGVPYVGLQDLYFLDLPTGQLRYWRGYRGSRMGEPIGAGRLLRRELLDRCDWTLWAAHRHEGMDHSSMARAAAIAAPQLLNVRALDGAAVDCKGPASINRFHPAYGPQVAGEAILGRLPAAIGAGLHALRTHTPRRTTMAPDTMTLRFIRNVSYQGNNYGPAYDEAVVDVRLGDARQFLQQGRAVPAETVAKHLGPAREPGPALPDAGVGRTTTRDPQVRTGEQEPATAPKAKAKGKGKGRGRRS